MSYKEDIAEKYLESHCSKTKIKIKLALKTPQIINIENSNISDKEKARRLKALYPKDKCWHKFITSDSGYDR